MPRRRLGPVILATGLVAIGLTAGGSSDSAEHRPRLQPINATTNHAAVVIDTGKEVKKFCLAFPEDEISGAEALRRIDAQVQFANFGSRGQAVCSLSGTGCPSSNCFCDANRFWAYHRAGPGGAPYSFSRTGASSTAVRNGDVEGWKWGAGEAPPAAKVSDVCNIDEPPVRSTTAASSTTTSTDASTTTSMAASPPGRESPVAPAPADGTPAVTPTSSAGIAPKTPTPPTPNAPPAEETATTPTPADPVEPVTEEPVAEEPTVVDPGTVADMRDTAAPPSNPAASESTGSRATLAVFGALLGGVLVWRARLRRAKVRTKGLVG